MNIRLIKKLDAIIGCLSASTFPLPVLSKLSATIHSVLIIRPGGIGDAVLLTPTIQFLKKTYPSLHLTVLAEQRNAGVFSLITGVDRLLCYDRPMELISVLLAHYDAVIDTEQWHRLSAVVARLTPAPVKIGFNTNERSRMFTHQIPYSQDDFEAVSFTHLLKPFGVDTEITDKDAPFLSISDIANRNASALLDTLQGRPFVTLFPGASIPERRWGADRFRRVAEVLSAFGVKVVVIGGKEDRLQGEAIVAEIGGLNLAGRTPLSETAGVIDRSSLLISGDSGVLHIAVGLGKPTVSLFGPGRAKKWAPRGNNHIVINKELPCSPCTTFGTTPACPINAQCMREITVDEVVSAVTRLLSLTPPSSERALRSSLSLLPPSARPM